MQLSVWTPTAAATMVITMDHLSGGRFILGLGTSGPQAVEGWYGQPYSRPLERTREYVAIVEIVATTFLPLLRPGRPQHIPVGTRVNPVGRDDDERRSTDVLEM